MKIILSIFLLNIIFSAFSQPSKRELIRNIIPVEEIGRSVFQAAVNESSQNPGNKTNNQIIDQFINMNQEEITESIIDIYDTLFSFVEIQQLGDFYSSPEGKKHKEYLPLLISKIILAEQKWNVLNQAILKVPNDTVYSESGKTPVKEFFYKEVEFQRDKPYKYRKSNKSRSLSESQKFRYEVYYNNKLWKEIDPVTVNPLADKAFRMTDKEVYAIVVAEDNDLNLKDLRYTVVYNLNSGSSSYEIQRDALRFVNGNEILSMEFIATVNEMEIKYHNYYYTDGSCVIQFSTFASLESYEKIKKDLEELLNGLVIIK
jgi:hypothetical protein